MEPRLYIQTMDGHLLTGGDLAEMAARWHAAHPQPEEPPARFEVTYKPDPPAPCGRCRRLDHRRCSGVRLSWMGNGYVPCVCTDPSHAQQVAS